MKSIVDILNAPRNEYISLEEQKSGVKYCAICGAQLKNSECNCIGSQLARNHNAHCELRTGA